MTGPLTRSMLFNMFQSMSQHIDVREADRLLGAGRHGTVVRLQRDDGVVALKTPTSPAVGASEAAALQRFDHRNIVDLVEHPIEGAPLVLEFCEGGTVADALADGRRFASHELGPFLEPLIDALDHIHQNGWVHGDVSPANIGLRSDGEPVLLDFGASRPADGTAIREGTPEFSGPIRVATPALDVRCLTSVALALLGPGNRWDDASTPTRRSLEDLLGVCDAGTEVRMHALRSVLAADGDVPSPHQVRTEGGGGSGASGTVAFGPRPSGGGGPFVEQTGRPPRRALLLLPLVAIVVFALGMEVLGSRPVEAADATPPLRTASVTGAAETLEAAGVQWSVATGTLQSTTTNERWLVGEPGDLAAVGRWSCSDDAMLGVYRPSTGEWFTFPTWVDDAESSAPVDIGLGSELLVASDGPCDRPVPVS